MIRNLALLRHGIASGQGPQAALLPEGALELRRLTALLASEGWRPGAVVTSPYRRAEESARIMVSDLAPDVDLFVLRELRPDVEPEDALEAVLAVAPMVSPVLIVSHLPLVARLVHGLIGEELSFSPGTFVEIVREGAAPARLLRRIGPRDLPGGFRGRGE